ncbi:MAG: hypothetical protein UT84_C0012G0011 [Candidatus Curtissbacteria bacterium GW2011_GWA1_40_16]|uniref:Uncharacterized protein n=1 Tax=Candidatus Curtissbacteria bacterium GW2011_GWA1_40_16 TaxID=1618405 RepID=A0A0G0RD26_9BACT|nr:MAG: hypothetical protein UT84_C0012G0011 [Candidatus Curtissbacteria bacterium GW2011_GWA1_40_16]
MTHGLPFKITPQIKRYVEELTLSDEFDSGGSKNLVDTFGVGERLSREALANLEAFLRFLDDSNVARPDEFPKIVESKKNSEITFRIQPKVLKIKVLDVEALRDFDGLLSKENNDKAIDMGLGWSSFTRSITYSGVKPYTFHAEKDGNKSSRQKLFEILYKNQRHIISGKTKAPGIQLEARFVATSIGYTQDTKTDRYNERGIKKTKDTARYLGKALKRFPLKISVDDGLLMTVTE